ncbi:hypothetical protein [Luteolibacter rhizosphaerae]|uniref:hypothetical protein n=1 Tax=Luteolibacter rhizosphaerae TaxID=2989719 RepID=UPI003CE5708C
MSRRNRADWRAVKKLWDELGYGEILSQENRLRIDNGVVPRVDEDWIAIHPEDEGLLGEKISIHHILGLSLSVPAPRTRHYDSHRPGGPRYNWGHVPSQLPIYRDR